MSTDASTAVTEDMLVPKPVEEQPKVEPTIEDLATRDYMFLVDEFDKRMETLTKKSSRRIVAAINKYPIEDFNPALYYKEEVELIRIGMKVFDCKFVLLKAALAMKDEEVKQKQKELKNEQGMDQ